MSSGVKHWTPSKCLINSVMIRISSFAGAGVRPEGARSLPSAYSSFEEVNRIYEEPWLSYESTDEEYHPRDERDGLPSPGAWPPYESTDEACDLRDERDSEQSGPPPRSESPSSRYATPPEYRTTSPALTDASYSPAGQARDGGEKSWERADVPVAGRKRNKARTAAPRPSPGRVQKKPRWKKKQSPARDNPDRARPAIGGSLQQTRHERAADKMLRTLEGNEQTESLPPGGPGDGDGDGQLSPSPPSPSALQHKQQQQQQQPKSVSRHRAGQPPQSASTALDGVRGAKIAKTRRKREPREPEASSRLLSAARQAPSGPEPPGPPRDALSITSVRRSRRLEEKAQGRAATGLDVGDRWRARPGRQRAA